MLKTGRNEAKEEQAKRFISPESLLPGRIGYLVRRIEKRLRNITVRFLHEGLGGVSRVAFHYR
jgi:hypothetical protein